MCNSINTHTDTNKTTGQNIKRLSRLYCTVMIVPREGDESHDTIQYSIVFQVDYASGEFGRNSL